MLQCQFFKILFFNPETNQKYLLEKYRVVRQWRIVRKPAAEVSDRFPVKSQNQLCFQAYNNMAYS